MSVSFHHCSIRLFIRRCYQKDELANPGNFGKKQCFFGNRCALDRKYFDLVIRGLNIDSRQMLDGAPIKTVHMSFPPLVLHLALRLLISVARSSCHLR